MPGFNEEHSTMKVEFKAESSLTERSLNGDEGC